MEHDVLLIFPQEEDETPGVKKENDVGLLFSASRVSGVDMSQQQQIDQCLSLIKNNTDELNILSQSVKDVQDRLTTINNKIITGTNLTEPQAVGDYYILQKEQTTQQEKVSERSTKQWQTQSPQLKLDI